VKACVKCSGHYVDISGELDFQRDVIHKYYDEALEKKKNNNHTWLWDGLSPF